MILEPRLRTDGFIDSEFFRAVGPQGYISRARARNRSLKFWRPSEAWKARAASLQSTCGKTSSIPTCKSERGGNSDGAPI